MKPRLHILQDEKIINRAIKNFEKVFPGENRFIILGSEDNVACMHVNLTSYNCIFVRKYNSDLFWETVGDVKRYSYIIIHFMSDDAAKFINKIDHSSIVWIEWGGDMYNLLLARRGFKLYQDERLVAKCKYPKLPFFLYRLIKNIKGQASYARRYRAIKKCRYFVPDSMEGEYELLLKYYPDFSHLELRSFFYYPIHEILNELDESLVSGTSVMVGNSASYTNNHIHVLSLLSSIGCGQQIIMPLSYPRAEEYVRTVTEKGKSLFGGKFTPITDYLPLSKYNQLMLSVNSFVYGNLRQEAVGNILIALYIGGKVFLEASNPLYDYYRSKGLCLFSIDEMDSHSLDIPLDSDIVHNNRRILDQLYSNERLEQLISKSFGEE